MEAFIPVEGKTPTEPVVRADGSTAVAESEWPHLPRNKQTGKLDKSAFLYDKAADAYRCPMGRPRALTPTATEEGKAAYRLRAPGVEGVFGVLKAVLGLRQFLMRGLKDVKTEWLGVGTAFNLRKLMVAWRAAPAVASL